jgi:RHS repeat-associated protein
LSRYSKVKSSHTKEEIVTYTYDDNGRITSDGSRTFVYNQHNRLVKVKQGETVIAEYAYNDFNQRIKKVVSGTTTYYHYNLPGNMIAESSGDGTPLRDYIYLNGERIAMKIYGEQEGFYYFINDHLGTPQQVIDSEGAVVWKAAYLPFGEAQILVETVVNNFRFPGQYFDSETGLHYNWHRYYDPKTGRYFAPDPIWLDGGINLYGYVEGNPINKFDPKGLDIYDDAYDGIVEGQGPWTEPLVPDPDAECPKRKACKSKAFGFLKKCNLAVTALQGTCIVACTMGTDGFGFAVCFKMCGIAMAPKRLACAMGFATKMKQCGKIDCDDECSE